MSDEMTMKDLQMNGLTEKIEMLLKGLEKSKRKELDLTEIGSRLRDFQTTLDSAQLELNSLSSKGDFAKNLRDHKWTLKELKGVYEWQKKQSNKNQLMGGASGGPTGSDMDNADDLMNHGLAVQGKSLDSLKRSLKVIEASKEIGVDAVTKLGSNTHQIEGIHGELTSVDTTLARSTKVTKRMARSERGCVIL